MRTVGTQKCESVSFFLINEKYEYNSLVISDGNDFINTVRLYTFFCCQKSCSYVSPLKKFPTVTS